MEKTSRIPNGICSNPNQGYFLKSWYPPSILGGKNPAKLSTVHCYFCSTALVKESSLKISSITHSHSILSLDTAQQKYAPVEFADNPTHR